MRDVPIRLADGVPANRVKVDEPDLRASFGPDTVEWVTKEQAGRLLMMRVKNKQVFRLALSDQGGTT